MPNRVNHVKEYIGHMSTQSFRNTVLVIEDDDTLREMLRAVLHDAGYAAHLTASGEDGLRCAAEQMSDLIILDLTLPGMHGFEVCQRLRTWYTKPILVLSCISEKESIIRALDLGADDYLTKPFALGELFARVRALLRRKSDDRSRPSTLAVGDLVIDFARCQVLRHGSPIHLTATEFSLLSELAEHAGCVLMNRMLLERVWGQDYGEYLQTLRVHISNLRKKIEPVPTQPRYLLSVQGFGYRLENGSTATYL